MVIYFRGIEGEFGFLSNFASFEMLLDGKKWATVEHYFQAQKFFGSEYAEQIRLANTPAEAKKLGRSRTHPLREDWEEVKEDIMRKAVYQKFYTHKDILNKLLATGDEELVENAPWDYYWGSGKDGTGKNRLGIILMEIRKKLRN